MNRQGRQYQNCRTDIDGESAGDDPPPVFSSSRATALMPGSIIVTSSPASFATARQLSMSVCGTALIRTVSSSFKEGTYNQRRGD